jgi:GMP synthase (glutamine-hydrolysing)
MKKEAIILLHVENDPLGVLQEVLEERNISIVPLYAAHDALTKALNSELLILMGGPMGANEEHLYPFLAEEMQIIKQRISSDQATLGVCLGAQLLAKAAGARVYSPGVGEYGWAPIHLTPSGKNSCLKMLDDCPVFHWHADTFDLPKKASLLASSVACPNQAFRLGENVLGIQFHIEVNQKKLDAMFPMKQVQLSPCMGDVQLRSKRCLHAWLDSMD